ncbi:hypothetical protein [Thaumasiovibrio subtropicus]|uniref:hypothetical protein n=1 Tax=Thaumasiovibrio subtropicus TaxID=1891207 RepID=UPI000B34B0C2|nr:hypothetical protein [Thaumasiovibrio subtropicus]
MMYKASLLGLALISPYLFAEELPSALEGIDIFRMPSVYVGLSVNSGLIELTSPKIGEEVKFKGDNNLAVQLGLMQPAAYFGESRWGYHTELYVMSLDNKFDAEDATRYRNGDISGYSVVAEPVLFYQWGSASTCGNCKGLRLQAGVGGRYVDIDGDVSSSNDTVRLSHSGFGFSSHLALVGHYGHWELALRLNSAVKVDDGDTELRKGMSQVTFGYRF